MRILSPSDLTGKLREQWLRARREMYRSLLRDPRSSTEQKQRARAKLQDAK